MERLYETLLQIPLFQGITLYDFNNLIGKLKWNFNKYKMGETIVTAGQPCDNVICVLSGSTSFTSYSPRKIYSITEFTDQPYTVEPYSLYGLENTYDATYKAITEVTIGSFSKLSFLTVVNNFLICRLNVMNQLSSRTHYLYKSIWIDDPKQDFESKIIRFILLHLKNPEGRKIIKMKLYDLASIADISHVNTSLTVNKMQKAGLIKLGRMAINVPDAVRLKEYYDSI